MNHSSGSTGRYFEQLVLVVALALLCAAGVATYGVAAWVGYGRLDTSGSMLVLPWDVLA
jgi:hypothetical protein